MDNDFMRWLMDHRPEGNGTSASAADNPHGWVEEKLEENAEYAFVETAECSWEARTLKKSRVITIGVKQEGQRVSWVACTNLVARDDTLIPLKVFLMSENGTFKHRGFLEPRPGEQVSFGASHRIEEGFDLNEFIERAANSLAMFVEPIERIIEGEDVSKVFMELKENRVKDAARMRRFGS